MVRDPLGFVQNLAREHGDVAFVRLGPEPFYLLSHPDHVRTVLVEQAHAFRKSRVVEEARRVLGDGLLTSEGDHHRRQRRMIQPAFHHARLEGYADAMAEEAAGRSSRWCDGHVVDVHREMYDLTLSIVGRTLFGSDVGERAATRVAGALEDALAMYEWLVLPLSNLIERIPTAGMRRFHAARASLDDVVFGMIRERRASSPGGDDLLSLLLAATDGEGGPNRMTDRQVRDEVMTLFLAGHETTSNALTWSWYLLSQDPAEGDAVAEEAARVLGARRATISDAAALARTRMVVAEAMRLYPPSWGMGRRAVEDVSIDGHTLPSGSSAMVSQWVIHHDPRWFPDPFRFDPGRWDAEAVAARPRYSFFPFGAGSRICIGEDFAWTEAVLLLATLARDWRLDLVPGQRIELEPRITLRPRGPIRVRLVRR
jgi:cytochrome P450